MPEKLENSAVATGLEKFSIPKKGNDKECLNYPTVALISGEGNSNPLQYSCLEDPMDGGAW